MLGEKLRHLRMEKGLNQGDIAKVIGISLSAYANYETGKSQPPLDKLIVLAKFFKVSLDWLCELNDEREIINPHEIRDFADLIRMFTSINKVTPIAIEKIRVQRFELKALLFLNGKINKFLGDFLYMNQLMANNTIDNDLYKLWIDKQAEAAKDTDIDKSIYEDGDTIVINSIT